MGREPFEAPGPPPIGRARPYQTPPGGPRRRGAINGLPRRLFVNPEPDRASPGPAPTPPPSPKCLHLYQSGWAGPRRPGGGGGRAGDRRAGPRARPGPHLAEGLLGGPRGSPTPAHARSPPLSPRASRTPQVCQSRRGSRVRRSPRPPRAARPKVAPRAWPESGWSPRFSKDSAATEPGPVLFLGPRRFR